jgi:serine/threonine-protein kinase HipA
MTSSRTVASSLSTSWDVAPSRAYVWVWLPGATNPVVAGRLDAVRGGYFTFTYGRSYLARDEAISLYEPELPLRRGPIEPPPGLRMASAIRDAGPDAWGQRVILARRVGHLDAESDTGSVDELTYLLESGSDRVGALDFQASATDYLPRHEQARLVELQLAAQALDEGQVLSPPVAAALLRGTSIGGARPKVLLEDDGRQLIAKLSSTTDPYPVVKAEAVGMELARRAGVRVPATELVTSLGRDVLLVERFDRTDKAGERRLLVSALTMLQLDEMLARYASYADLADIIRSRFVDPQATLRELFTRIVLNICIGNTDDHARNHAAFWDGQELTLTPAYDLCPQPRSGEEAAQAMEIGRPGLRSSQLHVCLDAAFTYQLDRQEAQSIIDATVATIEDQWDDAADAAHLTQLERKQLWRHQILSPFIFYR